MNYAMQCKKAGRPDANRAGNARMLHFILFYIMLVYAIIPDTVLRALAEGKVRWGFWPPGIPIPEGEDAVKSGNGI